MPKVKTIAKKILLKYFKTLKNKSAKELLDDTDCVIEIIPQKYCILGLLSNKFFNFIHCRI